MALGAGERLSTTNPQYYRAPRIVAPSDLTTPGGSRCTLEQSHASIVNPYQLTYSILLSRKPINLNSSMLHPKGCAYSELGPQTLAAVKRVDSSQRLSTVKHSPGTDWLVARCVTRFGVLQPPVHTGQSLADWEK
jgi:hypothetical protein